MSVSVLDRSMHFMSCSEQTAVFTSSVRHNCGSEMALKHHFLWDLTWPVLGQVSYVDGRPVQSIDYRSSGVIFNVQPQIRAATIDLNIHQQLSNFAKTETGVNNSPTLIKREVNTDVSLKDGDIILLGGLAENKDSNADTGLSFLPSWFGTTATEKAKTDIIIVLQARKIRR